MASRKTAPLIAALLVAAATAGASRAARAEDCLAGPNAPSPPGSHWYYHLDRATHRKCWYLGAQRAHPQRAAAERESAPPASADEPASVDAPAPAPSPAAASEPAEVPAERVAPAVAVPERIAARAVPTTTERVREPVPPTPQAAPTPAAEAPRGGLAAALFAIALLLAALGIMLVRGRRRLLTRGTRRPRPDGRAARHPRRVDWDTSRYAQSSSREPPPSMWGAARSPDERAAQYPGIPHAPAGHFVPGVMRAAQEAGPDIAAATLQPAIEELPPEPLRSAPDVEQSLRQLLAAWERRAA